MTAFTPAANAFEEQLEELGLVETGDDLGDLEALGRRAALLVAAEALWHRHLELKSREDVRQLMEAKAPEVVDELIRRHRLLAVPQAEDEWSFPAFQFDPSGRPYALLPDLLREFHSSKIKAHTIASWFLSPNEMLAGVTPAAWLREGREKLKLLDAARRTAWTFDQ